MDNDLMARRVRPPSEPFQPTPPSQPQPEQADRWPQDDVPEPPAEPGTRDPLARDEVPWDRPSDYADQTDSATLDQPAWDRPSNGDRFDAEPVDDGTPMDVNEPVAPWPQATQAPVAASAVPVAEMDAQQVQPDPDDAYAPVLGDLSVPMSRAWPEMNGRDAGRNDATVAPSPSAMSSPVAPAPVAQSAPEPEVEPRTESQPDSAWQAEAPGQTTWFTSAVEPTTIVAGLGPTPPAGLFDDAPEWEAPAVAQEASESHPESDPDAEPEPAPDAMLEPTSESEWPDPAPQSQPQPQPAPWDEPAAPVQTFEEATDVLPWAPARAPEPAPAPAPASVAPQAAEFAPARAPVADAAPAPFDEPAPRWAQPTYDAQPLAQAPVAQAPVPSPFAPAPVAGAYAQPVYAEPMYIDPLPASAPPITGERAGAAPQLATVAVHDQSDPWFLSTEPSDGEGADARDEVVEGKEPSALLTGILTIGMAVLVIVLVLVFIQLMTSLLR